MDGQDWREFIAENFAGDLEYHPRRSLVYLPLGGFLLAVSYLSARAAPFTYASIVAGAGGFALLVKGIFFLRKSSEGLGMSERELEALGTKRKALPSLPTQAGQVLQDFGAGPMLLPWPFAIIFDAGSKNSTNVSLWGMFAMVGSATVAGWANEERRVAKEPKKRMDLNGQ